MKKFPAKEVDGRISGPVWAHILAETEALRSSIEPLHHAYCLGVKTGDITVRRSASLVPRMSYLMEIHLYLLSSFPFRTERRLLSYRMRNSRPSHWRSSARCGEYHYILSEI